MTSAAIARADACPPGYPERVVYDAHGRADGRTFSFFQLLRYDGWSLGATVGLESVAWRMWKADWVAWREIELDFSTMKASWGPWRSVYDWPDAHL